MYLQFTLFPILSALFPLSGQCEERHCYVLSFDCGSQPRAGHVQQAPPGTPKPIRLVWLSWSRNGGHQERRGPKAQNWSQVSFQTHWCRYHWCLCKGSFPSCLCCSQRHLLGGLHDVRIPNSSQFLCHSLKELGDNWESIPWAKLGSTFISTAVPKPNCSFAGANVCFIASPSPKGKKLSWQWRQRKNGSTL